MLRQVAIAITASGGLGYGDKLAFASKTDLSAFSVFTKRTVLVVGTNTAKQMLNAGVEPTIERPWVVISRGGQAQHVNEPYKHMLYATDLGPATELAEQLVFNDGRLCGYTIVGGAQTYEKLIANMAGEGSIGEINSAYILKLAEPDAVPDVKLSVGADKFENLVRGNMIADVTVKRIKAEKEEESALRAALSCLGDAEGLTLPDGRVFKYAEQNGARRCDLDALKAGHPDIYDQFVTQGKHRTARLTGKAKV